MRPYFSCIQIRRLNVEHGSETLEETLKEFRRQFFGISSEKTSAASKMHVPSPASETPEEEPNCRVKRWPSTGRAV
jgi:hypothetical protein